MIEEIAKSPMFGITITFIAYGVGVFLYNRTKSYAANPMLIASSLIIIMLMVLKIPYQSYNEGGKYISFLLGPATVALAIPLYKNIKLIVKHKIAILSGVLCGCIFGILSAVLIAVVLGADRAIAVSMAPKSVTTPIAMEISGILKGYPSLTSAAVIITGIIGAIMGPEALKLVGVKNKIAKGIAIGTAAHGLGTSRAVQEGEVEGAMSGLAIGVAGVITSLITPIIIDLIF